MKSIALTCTHRHVNRDVAVDVRRRAGEQLRTKLAADVHVLAILAVLAAGLQVQTADG